MSQSVGDDGLPLDQAVESILLRHQRDPACLVQILRELQDRLDYISPRTVQQLAAKLEIPITRVKSTLAFYSFLYDEPRGRYRILFSDNITDRMLGSMALYRHMLNRLKLEPGEVSADGLVSVALTSCTGMCDQGPALLVNNRAVTRLTPERIDEIIGLIRAQVPVSAWPAAYFKVEDNIRRADLLLNTEWVPGAALQTAIERGPHGVLAELKQSNLRGRGGAGFTTGIKWEAARKTPAEARWVVCNADEGEPGTFKDRVLLQSYAGSIFEGMIIAAYTIGAKRGFLYLRGEYTYLLPSLEATLADLRRRNLLGEDICGVEGFDFEIDVHVGAGAYVCGEETALIESLEGKPGRPRIRPPFPVSRGYRDQPTVVNNVETLCKVVEVMLRGGAWYKGQGTRQSTGTKILSVSGDVERPGLYEYPFGVRVAQVLEDAGAIEPRAVQISGASGTCLTRREFGRRIAFEDVPTAGSFMVFGKGRDLFEMAQNFAHFFAHESCGFCTPCRVGTSLVASILDKIGDGHGTEYEMNELAFLSQVIRSASQCGLGQASCNALTDTIQKFRGDYERRLRPIDFEPAFDLDAALGKARAITGRDDSGARLSTRVDIDQ
ncbi:NAD(P)H-dependent oxidoreductase subunit E [Rhodovulum sp. PH10]|uniref:NAD(P)H-dependent oxidoreductase subunit E n=1 Tax=Rhodovulum sp. PH10 TaxID=1187851 RepID=UPI000691BA11|nr:NAD(P)H-dependent oxidoreductase subunit E [Rhodovulum sp. PH10]